MVKVKVLYIFEEFMFQLGVEHKDNEITNKRSYITASLLVSAPTAREGGLK